MFSLRILQRAVRRNDIVADGGTCNDGVDLGVELSWRYDGPQDV
ncbi:hypothetical protein [Sphingomonas sp. Leaf343]|nr:hypothetical protein [Sphingomonas sp. Leaf343]